jgi:hypothetical protein
MKDESFDGIFAYEMSNGLTYIGKVNYDSVGAGAFRLEEVVSTPTIPAIITGVQGSMQEQDPVVGYRRVYNFAKAAVERGLRLNTMNIYNAQYGYRDVINTIPLAFPED